MEDKSRVGVCIDTCHAFAAGYDLQHGRSLRGPRRAERVGFRLPEGHAPERRPEDPRQRVDRHTPLGEGQIGIECSRYIARDPRFEGIPLILENPDEARWPEEIARLKAFAEEE